MPRTGKINYVHKDEAPILSSNLEYACMAFFHHFGTMTHTPGIGNFSVKMPKRGFFRAFSCIVKSKNTSYIYLNLGVVLTYNHHCMMYYMRLCNVESSTVLSQLLP